MSDANIKLSRTYKLNGADADSITMREPTVNDQLTIAALKGADADKEIALFANLCGVSPADLKQLAIRDWSRLQKAYQSFLD